MADAEIACRCVRGDLWTAAAREGTITDSAFDRWLGQDTLFVGDLLTSKPGCWHARRDQLSQRYRRRSPTGNCCCAWMPRPTMRR